MNAGRVKRGGQDEFVELELLIDIFWYTEACISTSFRELFGHRVSSFGDTGERHMKTS